MYLTPLNPPTKEDAIYRLTHTPLSQVLTSIRPTDIQAVLHTAWPALQVLKEDKAIEILSGAIAMIVHQIATVQTMDGTAVRRAAVYLWEDYRHLTIEDVVLCLKMGIKGQLTEFYGRLDAQVIYNWFYEYNIERDEAARLDQLRHE